MTRADRRPLTTTAIVSAAKRTMLAGLAATLLFPVSAAANGSKVLKVAAQGDQAPGSSSGVMFTGFDEPMANARGDVVFGAVRSDSGGGFYLKPDGKSVQPIAQTGQSVPGVGTLSGDFFDFDGPAINTGGDVILVVRNITGSRTAAVLRKKSKGALAAILRQGDPVPRTNHGVFDRFDDIALNNRGDVAVIATYIENMVTKEGAFLRTADGKVVSILVDGDAIPACPGCTFDGTNTGDSVEGPWVNDRGVVAFQVNSISGAPATCTDPDTMQTVTCFEGSIFAKRPDKKRIENFVILGETLGTPDGTVQVETIGVARPALDVDDDEDELTFLLNGNMIADKVLGESKVRVCAKAGDSASGVAGELAGLSTPAVAHEVIEFNAEVEGNPNANIANGVFACANGRVQALAVEWDPKPEGGSFGTFEEGSIGGGRFVVIEDEPSFPTDSTVDDDAQQEQQQQIMLGDGVYRIETDD